MSDSYRPNRRFDDEQGDRYHRYRGRDYQDFDQAAYSHDSNFSGRHRDRRSRTRSPPRRLDYDDHRRYGGERHANDPYDRQPSRQQVQYPAYHASRSDQLRYRQDFIDHPDVYETAPRQRLGGSRDYYRHPPNRGPTDIYDQPYVRPPNYGENDHAKDPSSAIKYVLMVRDIKQSTTEALFAKGMEKLYRNDDGLPGGAAPQSIKRVILVRDRQTDESMGFGFVQYFTSDDAQSAADKAQLKEARDQMTIASAMVSVCFPKLAVFPHDSADFKPESNDKYKFYLTPDHPHKYYDRRYYASVLEVNETSPHAPTQPIKTSDDAESKTKPKKKKKKGGPVEANIDAGSRKRKALGSEPPAIFDKWSLKQAELRGEVDSSPLKQTSSTTSQPDVTTKTAAAAETSDEQTFAAQTSDGFACLLCVRQFPSEEMILRHVRESGLHKTKLGSESAIKDAFLQLEKRQIDPSSTVRLPLLPPRQADDAPIASSAQYRDRAAERREKLANTGTPSRPVSFSLKRKASVNTTSSDTDAGPPSLLSGKGSKMLTKQGWTQGQGLGSSGEGRTEALETNIYASGVGLGHKESLKGDALEEAGKATTQGYTEAGKERQWKRYDQV